MDAPLPALRRRAERRATTLPDLLLALALVALTVGDINGDTARHPVPAALAAVPVVGSLAWRRRHPAAVALAVCSLYLTLSATTPGDWPPQLMVFAVLVAVYSAAAHTGGRRSAVVGAVTLTLLVAAHVLTPDGDPDDFLPLLVWAGPWLSGRLVRRQTLQAAAAATRAADLERRREQDLREARDRERDRIARELHDVVAHAVSLMVVQAGAERLRLGDGAHPTRQVLDEVETTGRRALADLRTMLGLLRDPLPDGPGALTPQPRLDDLPALVDRVRAAGLPVQLDLTTADLPPALGLSAYRIVQEALTNVLKHAGPVATTVTVRANCDVVRLDVTSALPTPSRPSGDGRGLLGMRERAALHGGHVECGPEGDRWVVHAMLPVGAP